MLVLSRRAVIRIISFLSALTLTAGALVFTSETKISRLHAEITNEELRSLNDLTTYMRNIESTVLKGIYSSSSKHLSTVASKLSAECAAARYALGTISNNGNLLDRTYLFLAQVSDFSEALAKKASIEGEITPEDVHTLYSFMDYAREIGSEIETLLTKVQNGEINISDDLDPDERSFQDELKSSASTIDENFSEYPTLVYDGPFSDHIMNKTPLMTTYAPEVSEAAARKVAASVLGCSEEALSSAGNSSGSMPAYTFSNQDSYASVSKGGGFLIYMIKNESPSDILISNEDAIKKATEFLKLTGYHSMGESYFEISGGVLYINFAFSQNGITVYPDLVKIGVSLENGNIISFDARGYLVNHTERNPYPSISIEEAKLHLPSSVNVLQEGMAIVPNGSLKETLCYEFKCKGQRDENLIIYVDAQTGEEVSVMILLIGENGTLAM